LWILFILKIRKVFVFINFFWRTNMSRIPCLTFLPHINVLAKKIKEDGFFSLTLYHFDAHVGLKSTYFVNTCFVAILCAPWKRAFILWFNCQGSLFSNTLFTFGKENVRLKILPQYNWSIIERLCVVHMKRFLENGEKSAINISFQPLSRTTIFHKKTTKVDNIRM